MRPVLTIVLEELARTRSRPRRLLTFINTKRLLQHIEWRLAQLVRAGLMSRFGGSWTNYEHDLPFHKRSYSTYQKYVDHQSDKLQRLISPRSKDVDGVALPEYDVRYREVLTRRLEATKIAWNGQSVLCLGARLGTEVKCFLDLGCFAVGIDINPGQHNRYVLHGDFHQVQFPSASVDVVFTNSLDHVYSIERVSAEIQRVIKANGFLIVEAMLGSEEIEPNPSLLYESFYWKKIDHLVSLFERSDFRLVDRCSFDYPWPGEQLCFQAAGRH
jgi:SAM-dependent methyltransferase